MLKPSRYRERQTMHFAQACNNKNGPRPIKKVEYLMEHRGTRIILTDHVRSRAAQRHGMPIETMKTYFQHVVDGLMDFVWTEYNQEIFVYSRAFQRGMIIACRRDYKNQDNRGMAYVAVTCYPYGRAVPAQPDTDIVYVS